MTNFSSANTENFMTAMTGIHTILGTDEYTAKASVSLLIDLICAKYGGDPAEFARDVADVVAICNDALGNIGEHAETAFDRMFEDANDALDNLINGLHPAI